MLPALIALKGIMKLASAGSAIANLVKAMVLINAGGAGTKEGFFSKLVTKNGLLGVALLEAIPLIVTIATLDVINREFANPKNRQKLANAGQSIVAPSKFMPKAVNGIFVDKNGYDSSGNFVGKTVGGGKPTGAFGSGVFANGKGFGQGGNTNNVTINVQSADPKAVVDALGKYVKTNGKLPASLFPRTN
jgi:hypothetical protein